MTTAKGIAVLLLSATCVFNAPAQEGFEEFEDSLIAELSNIWAASNNETKRHLNNDFKDLLIEVIEMEGSYDYAFDSLSWYMGIIESPDDAFRIYNWNIELTTETYEYFCLIHKVDKKGVTENVIELIDYQEYISKIEQKELEAFEWYGALYYDIIPFEKNNHEYYALLGLDMNDTWSKIKLIEVIEFEKETVTLGASVFKMKNGVQRRFMIECKKDNELTLTYEKKDDMIVFNHLMPMDPRLEDQYDFYVNDLSFDAFEWDKKKEQWVYIEDIDAQNDKDEQSSHHDLPDWEDPEEDFIDPGDR